MSRIVIEMDEKPSHPTDIINGVEVEDLTSIIDDHFHRIPVYCCRSCGRRIIPYSETFESEEYDCGSFIKWKFNQEYGYCRLCAYKLSKERTRSYGVPNYVKYPNEHAGETMYFLNENGFPTGEKIEEDLTLPDVKVYEM